MFKTRLKTFGNDFRLFCNFEKFLIFFENFRRLDPPWNTGQKKFFEKVTQNMFKTRLKTFGNDFRLFCNFEKFLIFFENFRQLDPPRNTEQKNFFEKSPQNMFKTRLDTFGNHLGLFCNFENFLIFLKVFEDSTFMEHWAKNFFKKINPKHVQNMFGHFWERFRAFLHF